MAFGPRSSVASERLTRRASRCAGFFLLALGLLARSACAQLPSPRLDSAFPLGGRIGTAVEVVLTGSEMPDASALIFENAGLVATRIDTLKFRVAIASDCPRGMHEMRAVSRYGVSTPLPFVVSDIPEMLDAGANHTRETATKMDVPQIVHGRADAEQQDFYKFSAKKDQTLQIACISYGLDSPMDPVLVVTDAKGATVAEGDDELDRDAVIRFVVPADGEYFLVVHDKLFAGSAAHAYRLAVGEDAATIMPTPLAGNGDDFGAAGAKAIAEVEPNDLPATAQAIDLPGEVQGTFDCDWFTCRAEANRPLWLEIIADREGNASDALLVIYKVTHDAGGQEQARQVLELDDQPDLPAPPVWQVASRDPAGRFVPDESATYRFRLTDRFGGHGHYRFIVREAAPDFSLRSLGESPANEDKKIFKWQPNLRRGGSAYFHIAALRRGYDGEINLRAEGLPESVTASGWISAGSATGFLVLQAKPEAPPWAGYVRVFGEGGGLTREIHCVNYRWTVDNRDNQRLASRLVQFAVGIADEVAPIGIAATESKTWETNPGADLEIPLQFTRANPNAQPKGEWQLAPVNLPGLKKFDPLKFDGAAAKEAKLVLRLQKDGNDLKPGTYTMLLRARGSVAYKADAKGGSRDVKDVEFSGPITVKVAEPAATPAGASIK